MKTKKQLRDWMNFYHDKWIELHNKYEVVKTNNSQFLKDLLQSG